MKAEFNFGNQTLHFVHCNGEAKLIETGITVSCSELYFKEMMNKLGATFKNESK